MSGGMMSSEQNSIGLIYLTGTEGGMSEDLSETSVGPGRLNASGRLGREWGLCPGIGPV